MFSLGRPTLKKSIRAPSFCLELYRDYWTSIYGKTEGETDRGTEEQMDGIMEIKLFNGLPKAKKIFWKRKVKASK